MNRRELLAAVACVPGLHWLAPKCDPADRPYGAHGFKLKYMLQPTIHCPELIDRDFKNTGFEKCGTHRPEKHPLRAIREEFFWGLWQEDAEGKKSEISFDEGVVPLAEGERRFSYVERVVEVTTKAYVCRPDGGYGSDDLLFEGHSGWSEDLVEAMVRSREWGVAKAIRIAVHACERCVNVLAREYGLTWGYDFDSDDWRRSDTFCYLCEPDHVYAPMAVPAEAVSYGYSSDGEHYCGNLESREHAIRCLDGERGFTAKRKMPDLRELVRGAANHDLEELGMNAEYECGEVSEGWPETTVAEEHKLQDRLEATMVDWLKETGHVPTFWQATEVQEHNR